MHRGFAAILIVGLVMAIFALDGVFYLKQNQKLPSLNQSTAQSSPKPTPDETVYPDSIGANWKTYTNTSYGFSIKYPEKYYVKETSDKDYDTFNLSIASLADTKEFFGSDAININVTVANKNFKGMQMFYNSCCAYGWTKTNFAALSKATNGTINNHLTKIDNLTIDNVKGVEFKLTKENTNETLSIPTLYAAFLKNDNAYLIDGITGNENSIFTPPYTEIFDQILSTFQFTD